MNSPNLWIVDRFSTMLTIEVCLSGTHSFPTMRARNIIQSIFLAGCHQLLQHNCRQHHPVSKVESMSV